MNWNKALMVLVVFIVYAAAEAIKFGLTAWADLLGVQYVAGTIVEVGMVYGLYRVGVNQPVPRQRTYDSTVG
jgi:hypothetical protein